MVRKANTQETADNTRNKKPVYMVDSNPAQLYVENVQTGGAPPADFNPDTQRLSRRCYQDMASWWASCAWRAEQEAVEYRALATDARKHPEKYVRVSAGKRYRATIEQLNAQKAQQAAELAEQKARADAQAAELAELRRMVAELQKSKSGKRA